MFNRVGTFCEVCRQVKCCCNITSTKMYSDGYGTPERVSVEEYPDRIEMIYKQSPNIYFTSNPLQYPPNRVFKIIYSCKDGKWNKSEPIFGKVIPEQKETYEF